MKKLVPLLGAMPISRDMWQYTDLSEINNRPNINHKNKDINNRYNNSKIFRSTCRDWQDYVNDHNNYNGASSIPISHMIASC